MSSLIIIPARLGSTRLPNKILADINGKTMIRRVCDQARKVKNSNVYIACGDQQIASEVRSFAGKYIMTDPNLPSGTDRIYAAFSQLSLTSNYAYIVNLQGDVPNIDPAVIEETINVLNEKDECDIATAVIEFSDEGKANDPNIVKAIANFGANNNISECIDFKRGKPVDCNNLYYEHIGIYVYRKAVLEKFVKLDQSNREISEKLEQLRALDNGMRIFACLINSDKKPINVDTEASLEQARNIITD
jgi:3-deoxy-manno-octulosonate cytidylyltransferase (CMP-KDO synthetase)